MKAFRTYHVIPSQVCPIQASNLQRSLIEMGNIFTAIVSSKYIVLCKHWQGYIIYSVKQKLKREYITLSGHEIKNLRLSGVEVCLNLLQNNFGVIFYFLLELYFW